MNDVVTGLKILLFLLAAQISAALAANITIIPQKNPDIVIEQLAQGLGVPWGMAFLNADELIFTERSGQVKQLNLTNLTVETLMGAPAVFAEGQGGMLDVAIGPNYGETGWIYFTYSKPVGHGGATTLARAKRYNNRLTDWQDLLVSQAVTNTGQHFGSRIAFDDDNHIYFGIGDRGERDQAQNLDNHMGSILRLNLDGSVPDDNPFSTNKNARDEIWSYGHRNPQGLQFDQDKKIFWSIEHGPRGGDEINLIQKGKNYGWPVVSHGKEYWGPFEIGEGQTKLGIEPAVKVYIPSIAPGSLLLYSGTAFPNWQGSLFAGALKLQHLNRISISADNRATNEERLLGDLNQRIRALAQSPQGWIYVSTDSGNILRLRPVSR
ncbi:MAG: glucose/arabinose dehydrogenase [Chitinophagales bacterium]|jgi:glucose/arabinose dehydrogenase